MPAVFKLNPFAFPPFNNKSKSSPPPPPLRLADVLLLQDHDEDRLLLLLMDGGGGGRSLNYTTTPRRIAARLLSALNCCKVRRRPAAVEDKKQEDDDVAPLDVTDAPQSSSVSERCRREVNMNVGIGCCLLHLIAESKTELQKVTELRIQMETVLQTVKEELPSKDSIVANKLESDNGVEESLGLDNNVSSNIVLIDQSNSNLKCDDDDGPKDDEDCMEEMDRLEAELEAELERLQYHLDTGKLPANPPQETTEESASISTGSGRSFTISCGEVIDPTIDGEEEDCLDSHCGVPPFELERKLHELLETRQQQQIRELEAALGRARQELLEKEREISWWKDTAQLMSRHVNQPSRLNFQQHTHPLLR